MNLKDRNTLTSAGSMPGKINGSTLKKIRESRLSSQYDVEVKTPSPDDSPQKVVEFEGGAEEDFA